MTLWWIADGPQVSSEPDPFAVVGVVFLGNVVLDPTGSVLDPKLPDHGNLIPCGVE